MKHVVLVLAAAFALMGQTPSPAPMPGSVLHLTYQWGFNTGADHWGQGTGTTTVDLVPASDGGVMVYGTDWLWDTLKARETNACEAYPAGTIDCKQAPNAISPIQLTLFPLVAGAYFSKAEITPSASWHRAYTVHAAIAPIGSSMLSQPDTYTFDYSFQGQGKIPNENNIIIQSTGTFARQGGFFHGKGTQRIAYDPVNKIPLAVNDVRTHLAEASTNNNDAIELRLMGGTRP